MKKINYFVAVILPQQIKILPSNKKIYLFDIKILSMCACADRICTFKFFGIF